MSLEAPSTSGARAAHDGMLSAPPAMELLNPRLAWTWYVWPQISIRGDLASHHELRVFAMTRPAWPRTARLPIPGRPAAHPPRATPVPRAAGEPPRAARPHPPRPSARRAAPKDRDGDRGA